MHITRFVQVQPWIRLNRVVRDIPTQYIMGGVNAPNLREDVLKEMARRGRECRCLLLEDRCDGGRTAGRH